MYGIHVHVHILYILHVHVHTCKYKLVMDLWILFIKGICVDVHVHVQHVVLYMYLLILNLCFQDPDYIFELPEDNPEFKKLAFVSPGPKNAFAPLKRSSRRCVNTKDKGGYGGRVA